MVPKKLPPRELVHQLLTYDHETGEFMWLPRPREMFKSLNQFLTWNTRFAGKFTGNPSNYGYLKLIINSIHFPAHRIAWLYVYGEPVPSIIDHADHDPSNNRISNLRPATKAENNWNAKRRKDNITGVKGVSGNPGRYRARVNHQDKIIHVGYFASIEEAAEARREAASRLHGEFARYD